MKKLMIVLPLTVLLAYCSSTEETRTMDYDPTATASSTIDNTGVDVTADASITTSDVATSTDVNDVNTNTSTVTIQDNEDAITASATLPRPDLTGDVNDPMYQHWLRTNSHSWTWDMDHDFYRPMEGTYDAAVNGSYQLIMTPELANAWKLDRSLDLWRSSTAYSNSANFNNRQLLFGDTYISASESFDDNQTSAGVDASVNAGTSGGSVSVNGSTSAGTVSSNANASTHSLNNNASSNSASANTMNGSTNTTADANLDGSAGVNSNLEGSVTVDPSISVNGNTGVNATTNMDGTMGATATTGIESGVNYTAANGNSYAMPRLNLYLDNGSFTGYTGCNAISGRLEVSGTNIRFLNTTPSTNIDCMGGLDQAVFLEMLKNIDSYAYVNNELQLLRGNEIVLRFRKDAEGSDVSVK